MKYTEAYLTLETLAIDITGSIANKENKHLSKCIKAIDLAQKVLKEKEKSVAPHHVIFISKDSGRRVHTMYCGKCGKYSTRVCYGDKFCRQCGTKIDWSK